MPAVADETRLRRRTAGSSRPGTSATRSARCSAARSAASGGTRVALLIDAASFAVVAVVALVLRPRRAPARDRAGLGRARDGIVFLLRDRVLALVISVAFVSLLFMTASATAEVFFATDVLGAGDLGYGVLMTAWTAGMVLGATTLPRRVPAAAAATVALVAIAVQGLGLALPTLWLALGFALVAYVVGGPPRA